MLKYRITAILTAFAMLLLFVLPISAVSGSSGNLFAGIIATSSNTDSWFASERPIKYLTDGTGTNPWANPTTITKAANSTCAWVQFDLEEAKDINKIVIQQRAYVEGVFSNVKDIAIDVIDEKGDWKRVAAEYNISNTYAATTMTFEAVKTATVKITVNCARTGGGTFNATEIEAYFDSSLTQYTGVKAPDTSANAIPFATDTVNIFLGITGTSSNTDSWFASERPITNLTDGNSGPWAAPTTVTAMNGTYSAWVEFALPEAKTINKVVVQQRAYVEGTFSNVKDIGIDVLLTDGTWKRVAAEYNISNTYAATTLTFPTETATAVRIITNGARVSAKTFNATEIEGYCDSTVVEYSGIKQYDSKDYIVPTTTDFINVLSGLTAVSSNTDDWFAQFRPISNLTDGKNTQWSEPCTVTNCGNTTCAWIQFNLPKAEAVNKVTVQQRSNNADNAFPQIYDLAVDVRLADGNWKRVAERYNISDTSVPTVFTFEKTEITAVRVVTSSVRTGKKGFHVTEIEAYCDSRVTEYTGNEVPDNAAYKVMDIAYIADNGLVNLFSDTELESSTSEVWLMNNRKLEYLNDGETTAIERLRSTITFNDGEAWYQMNFEQAEKINKVIVQNCMFEQGAADMAIDVMLSDGSWKRVAARYNISDIYANIGFVFEPTEVLAVRVSANGKRYNCGNFSVSEIAGYYDPSATVLTGIQTPDLEEYTVPDAKDRQAPVAKFDNLSTSPKGAYVPTPQE